MAKMNCTEWPPLQPDPDISGIGVLIAFIVTAGLTLICCVLQYFLEYSPHKSSLIKNDTKRACIISALKGAILGSSDQQVFTGLAVLIAGYIRLPDGIAVYHWRIVSNLAWFSTITHLITLTSLRSEIRHNDVIRLVRITSMGLLLGLLIPALASTGYLLRDDGDVDDDFPAWCLFHPELMWGMPYFGLYGSRYYAIPHLYNVPYVIIAILFLLYGYVTRVIILYQKKEGDFLYVWLHIPARGPWILIESLIERVRGMDSDARAVKLLKGLVYKSLRTIYALLVACEVVYGSSVWEFTWLSMGFLWGIIQILYSRANSVSGGATEEDVIIGETVWAFGQILAVILLILPILGFIQAYSLEKNARKEKSNTQIQAGAIPRQGTPSEPEQRSRERVGLESEPWFYYLNRLLFIISLEFAVELLVAFPGTGHGANLASDWGVEEIGIAFAVLLATNFCVLFFSTIILLDAGLQTLWRNSTFAHSVTPWARGAWIAIVVALVCCSLLPVIYANIQYP